MQNEELVMTLDDAVAEVLGLLTGLDLQYAPELDRYQAITRVLNRALRANALEKDWSFYASTESVGPAMAGQTQVVLRASVRPRMVNDDAVRLVDSRGQVRMWAYFLPRDAIHKYGNRRGLWCAVTRGTLTFSRPFTTGEDGLDIQVPVLREPKKFRLPLQPEDPDEPLVPVDQDIRDQPVDFAYPDLIVARAAYFYAQTDPVMQPRVQTLENEYKTLMYQLIERDDRNTDTPYLNEFFVPVESSIFPRESPFSHGHPHADERM